MLSAPEADVVGDDVDVGFNAVSVFLAESTLRSPMRSRLCRIWRCRFERVDDVHVDDADRAHARGREVEGGRRAETTGTEEHDLGAEQLLLAFSPTSGQKDVPGRSGRAARG